MNLTTVDDPIQRKFLPSFLRGVAEENKLVTSPNFVVTQALVALLADKGARLRPGYDKAELEKRGQFHTLIDFLLDLPKLFRTGLEWYQALFQFNSSPKLRCSNY